MAYGTLGYGSQAYGAWEYGTRRPVLLAGDPVTITASPAAAFQKIADVEGGSAIYTAAGVDRLRLVLALAGNSDIRASRTASFQKLLALAGSLHSVTSSDVMLEVINRFGGSGIILTDVTGDMQRIAALSAAPRIRTTKSARMQRIAPMGATVNVTTVLTDAFRIDLYFKPETLSIAADTSARMLTVLPARGAAHIQLEQAALLQRLPKLGGASLIAVYPTGRLTGDFRFIGQDVLIQTVTYGALRKEWEPLVYDGTIWGDVSYPVTVWAEVDHGEDVWRPYDHFS